MLNLWEQLFAFRRVFVVVLVLLGAGNESNVRGEEYKLPFDSPETSWKVFVRPQETKVTIHERRRGAGRTGGAEFIRLNASQQNARVRLEHPLPAATVLDELEVAVWLKANSEGFVLETRVVLADVPDPDTQNPITITLTGDRYKTANEWQLLKCRMTDKAVSEKLRSLRAYRQMTIDPRFLHIDRIALNVELPPGVTDLFVDNINVSPFVQPSRVTQEKIDRPIVAINHAEVQPTTADVKPDSSVKFRLHRLFVDQNPFFPRIVNDHGERPAAFKAAGINTVWVKDFEHSPGIAHLRAEGLKITAVPPFATGTEGEPLDSEDANLMPFQANSSPVLFWMLGARLTSDGKPRLTSWANQVRNADRRFQKRPIAADVIDNERLCSRHIDILGISRHIIHSNGALSEYRDWLIQRRDQAWPDTFCFTWIQTEPAPMLEHLTRSLEYRPMLEPEQIRLQVYAALAAGCRGLGFWTTTPLDQDTPAARERTLTLAQLNLELELLEPWITASGVPQLVSFKVDSPRSDQKVNLGATPPGKSVPAKSQPGIAANRKPQRELQAALIRAEQGALLLPMWLDEHSQFVPGQMAARDVTIVVPGGGETAAVWEISTTGQLRNLNREPAAGGIQIKLPRLDQTAAILITANHSVVEEMNQRIANLQEQSARVSVELARLKLERIRQVDLVLQRLGAGKVDGPMWLGEAKMNLDKADRELRKQQFADARQSAAQALQLGRLLQRTHWESAVRRLPNLTASPYALSFQSLPEHWKLTHQLEKFGSLDSLENLLPSGAFEDLGTLVAEHWKTEQSERDTIQSTAELPKVAYEGKSSLRLSASPLSREELPKSIPRPVVTLTSPGISVQAGNYVRITGMVKIPANLIGGVEGAMIYDSLLGKQGAVRLKDAQDWKKFELVRPVTESQDLTITLSLQALGEVYIDDLRVSQFELRTETLPSANEKSAISPANYSPLDLRQFNPLPKRK